MATAKKDDILSDDERKRLLTKAAREGSASSKIQAIRMIEGIEARERKANPGVPIGDEEPGGFDELDELEPRRRKGGK